jgi:hypothetical protein
MQRQHEWTSVFQTPYEGQGASALQERPQRRESPRAVGVSDRPPQSPPRPHQADQPPRPRDRRVDQIALEHDPVLSVDGDDDRRVFRPLRLVDRDRVGERELVQLVAQVADRPMSPLKTILS